MENMVETIFPPSAYVFNKIDMLVHISEILPGKFDNVVDEFPMIIAKVPFLNWASTHLSSGLKFLISTLTDWRTDGTKKKEIMIDINCDDLTNELASEDTFQCPTRTISHAEHENEVIVKPSSTENSPPVSDTPQTETKSAGVMDKSCAQGGDGLKPMKCTYKEVLEKGKKENVEEKCDCGKEETQEAMVSKGEVHKEAEMDANGRNEGVVKEDTILELFESGWHMNPGIGGNGKSAFLCSFTFEERQLFLHNYDLECF
ncbi:hypothetical protein HHK36_029449 [Tetracentron sinense]|uniref:Uncharacterized protein n=1 Tax=Tetracentron sinense TaxID=13715 RepID=A0A835CZD0_TETSI|nr:hypothetical protein HHK36_029449 [Tetracentron sinense]